MERRLSAIMAADVVGYSSKNAESKLKAAPRPIQTARWPVATPIQTTTGRATIFESIFSLPDTL